MQIVLHWQCCDGARDAGLPEAFVTFGPPFLHPDLPTEALMLLPRTDGSQGLLDAIARSSLAIGGNGVGLLVTDPFLNPVHVAARLKAAGAGWIAGLPSIVQHDEAFRSQLSDVGFGLEREIDMLAEYSGLGLRTLGVVAEPDDVAALSGLAPDAVLVMPTLREFEAGMPSLHSRLRKARAVREQLAARGHRMALLCLMSEREAEGWRPHHRDDPDGALMRPQAQTLPGQPESP